MAGRAQRGKWGGEGDGDGGEQECNAAANGR